MSIAISFDIAAMNDDGLLECVGAMYCVFLWCASTSKVTHISDLSETEDVVTSWRGGGSEVGQHLAVNKWRKSVPASSFQMIGLESSEAARS